VTAFDLVFLVSFFAVLATFGRVLYLFVRGRRQDARRTAMGLVVFVGLYMIVLLIVSLASPQKVLSMGEPQCFDDWCMFASDQSHEPGFPIWLPPD